MSFEAAIWSGSGPKWCCYTPGACVTIDAANGRGGGDE